MPLYQLLQTNTFDPSDIQAMAYAFEAVCQERKLRPVNDDPLRELIAKKVIEFARRGERDPERLRELVSASVTR